MNMPWSAYRGYVRQGRSPHGAVALGMGSRRPCAEDAAHTRARVRRASLLNDLLIALTARDLGAVLLTRDESDFSSIREVVPFTFEVA